MRAREELMEEKKGDGFTFKDKECCSQDETVKQAGDEQKPGAGAKRTSHDRVNAEHNAPPLPEINFASFILSLSSSALFLLGDIPDPATNLTQRNLPLAKQTIDILGILNEKTVGNLVREVSQLLESLLYDLRMRYVEELKKDAP